MLIALSLLSAASAASLAAAPPAAIVPGAPSQAAGAEWSLEEFRAGLMESAGGPVFAAIERHFPKDSEPLLERLFELASANRGSFTEMLRVTMAEMDAYVRSKSALVLRAPAPTLVDLNERTLALFRLLHERDPAICARMAMGEGAITPRDAVRLQSREASQLTLGLIEAAGLGSRKAETPGRGEMRDEDAIAWMVEIDHLDADGTLLPLLIDPAAAAAAPAERQCRLGVILHESISRLPEEVAANIYAALLAEAFRQPSPIQR